VGADADAGFDDGEVDADAAPLEETANPETVYDAYAEAACDLGRRCEAVYVLANTWEFYCHPDYEDLVWGSILVAWRSGHASYDPVLAEACLDAIRAIEGCPALSDLPPSECFEMVSGTVAEDGACNGGAISGECVSDLHCVMEGECPGRCEPYSEVGEACHGARICMRDLACRDGLCVARAGVGEPCADRPCAERAYCLDGVCAAFREVGESCDEDRHCAAWPPCAEGVCEPYPGTMEGAACWPTPGCPYPLACIETTDPMSGEGTTYTCTRGVARGEACDDQTPCSPGDRCDGGTCRQIVGSGAQCGAMGVCPEAHDCIDGNCVPQPSAGEPCESQCLVSRCTDGLCVPIDPTVCSHRVIACPVGTHCASVGGENFCRPTCP
jgi:hypothetical protein